MSLNYLSKLQKNKDSILQKLKVWKDKKPGLKGNSNIYCVVFGKLFNIIDPQAVCVYKEENDT